MTFHLQSQVDDARSAIRIRVTPAATTRTLALPHPD